MSFKKKVVGNWKKNIFTCYYIPIRRKILILNFIAVRNFTFYSGKNYELSLKEWCYLLRGIFIDMFSYVKSTNGIIDP